MNFFHKMILWIGTRIYPYKIYGTENIPEGGAVIPYNHFSVMDPFFIRHAYKGKICFPAKIELFKNKFFANLLRGCGAIPVDRANPGVETMLTAIKTLRNGDKLVISPEGTRNKTGSLDFLPFKEGTVLFAVKGKAPIVPCIVAAPAKPFKRTNIVIGKPFDFSEYYGKRLTDEDLKKLNAVLVEKMKETQTEFLAFLADKKKKKKKRKKDGGRVNEDARA